MRAANQMFNRRAALVAVVLAVATAALCPAPCLAEKLPTPLAQAHAHNDYLHTRPLLDALDHGFCGVEADVYLVDGQLLVAHTRLGLDPQRTLVGLYLDPLQRRIKAHGGSVYGDGTPLTLLVDIKDDAEKTYARLHETLARYADMLTVVRDGVEQTGPVRVVISGNRPIDTMRAQPVRYAGIDGRLSNLGSDAPAHLLPLISDRWSAHFRWRGQGPISETDRAKLRDVVRQAHEKNRRVRFWATPEHEAVWRELADAGVDLINTDDLPGLQKFLSSPPAGGGVRKGREE